MKERRPGTHGLFWGGHTQARKRRISSNLLLVGKPGKFSRAWSRKLFPNFSSGPAGSWGLTLQQQIDLAEKKVQNYLNSRPRLEILGSKTVLCSGQFPVTIPHLEISRASAFRGVGMGSPPRENGSSGFSNSFSQEFSQNSNQGRTANTRRIIPIEDGESFIDRIFGLPAPPPRNTIEYINSRNSTPVKLRP